MFGAMRKPASDALSGTMHGTVAAVALAGLMAATACGGGANQTDATRTHNSAPADQSVHAQPRIAGSMSRTDPSGDIWDFDMKDGGPPQRLPRDWRDGDVRRVWIRHGKAAMTLRVSFLDLDRGGGSMNQLLLKVALRTNEGVRRNLELGWEDLPAGSERLSMSDQHSMAVPCRTAGSIDWITNKADVRVPRSCLSEPLWVQVAVRAEAVFNNYSLHWDDGLAAGPPVARDYVDIEDPFDPATWTPRLFRG
jgi:hypothetical protein